MAAFAFVNITRRCVAAGRAPRSLSWNGSAPPLSAGTSSTVSVPSTSDRFELWLAERGGGEPSGDTTPCVCACGSAGHRTLSAVAELAYYKGELPAPALASFSPIGRLFWLPVVRLGEDGASVCRRVCAQNNKQAAFMLSSRNDRVDYYRNERVEGEAAVRTGADKDFCLRRVGRTGAPAWSRGHNTHES